jgi:hypothetical protein
VHLGRIAAGPLVALDRPREPPARIGRGGQQRFAERGGRASERDPFEALAVIAAADAADMALADDAALA